jgi:DNA-binding transcriptional ArsR family regulator/predicted transcriptional regulator
LHDAGDEKEDDNYNKNGIIGGVGSSDNSGDNHHTADNNRSRIYEFIQQNPGVHLRKIVKELGLAMGHAQYHLNILEKSGRIKSRKSGLHRNYYSVAIVNGTFEIILAFLRQETSRDILVYLMEHPGSTQSDIANFKHFSSPTINWHMSRLMDNGMVESTKEGRTVRYSIKGAFIQNIGYLLKAYHPSVWSSLASRLAEVFLELSTVSRTTATTTREEQEETGKDDNDHNIERRR